MGNRGGFEVYVQGGTLRFWQSFCRQGLRGHDHPSPENVNGGGCTPIRYTCWVNFWFFRGCPPPIWYIILGGSWVFPPIWYIFLLYLDGGVPPPL